MTLPTYDSALDEMLGLFNTDWTTKTPALTTTVPDVQWPGLPAGPGPVGKSWARIRIRHTSSRQVTFGPPGQRRFERGGIITVQVFAPLSPQNGLSLAEKLAIIARDAYEGRGTATGIWFRNARIVEVGPSGEWYQYNAVVEFQYDEMR